MWINCIIVTSLKVIHPTAVEPLPIGVRIVTDKEEKQT